MPRIIRVAGSGPPIKIPTIVDQQTREGLGGRVERSITGVDLIAEVDHIAAVGGTSPTVLRCDGAAMRRCCDATTDPN